MKNNTFKDLKGMKFNRLHAIEFSHFKIENSGRRRAVWIFECECGALIKTVGTSVSSGNRKSCGCMKKEKLIARMKLKKKPNQESVRNELFARYKREARYRKLPFVLSKKSFMRLIAEPCHYCGEGFEGRHTVSWNSDVLIYNGIDRKNPLLGYSSRNCVTCCKTCNMAKNKLSYFDFLSLVERIHKHRFINK